MHLELLVVALSTLRRPPLAMDLFNHGLCSALQLALAVGLPGSHPQVVDLSTSDHTRLDWHLNDMARIAATLLPRPLSQSPLRYFSKCLRYALNHNDAFIRCRFFRHADTPLTLQPNIDFLLSPLVWLSAFHFTSLITVFEYRRHNTFSLKLDPIACHPGGIDGDHPFQVLRSPVLRGQRLLSLPRLAQCRLQARLTPHNRTLAGPPPELPWPRPAQKQPIITCPCTAPTAPTSAAVFRALHSTRTTGR